MKKQLSTFASACLLLILVFFTSCSTTHRAALAKRTSRQPKFINGIYLSGHVRTSATANAIDTHNPIIEDEQKAKVEDEAIAINDLPPTENSTTDDDTEEAAPINVKELSYSELIGIPDRNIEQEPLYRFIDKWYGTRYRLGGVDELGIDCSGFSQKLYGSVYGVDIDRTANEQYKTCKRVKKTIEAQEGDLVFFRHRGKKISHVGVYLANDYFVHSSTSHGVVISSLKDAYWSKRYVGIGKMSKDGITKL